MKNKIIGVTQLIIGVLLVVFLSWWLMLYCGIANAVNNWGIDNTVVINNIVRAALFNIGAIPGAVFFKYGNKRLYGI